MSDKKAFICIPTFGPRGVEKTPNPKEDIIRWLRGSHARADHDPYATWPAFLNGLQAGQFTLHLGPDYSGERELAGLAHALERDLGAQGRIDDEAIERLDKLKRMRTKWWDKTGPITGRESHWPHAAYAESGKSLCDSFAVLGQQADAIEYIDPYAFTLTNRSGLRDLLSWVYWRTSAEKVSIYGHQKAHPPPPPGDWNGPNIAPAENAPGFRTPADSMQWFATEWLPHHWLPYNNGPPAAAVDAPRRQHDLTIEFLITAVPDGQPVLRALHDRMLCFIRGEATAVFGIGHGIRAFENAIDNPGQNPLRTTVTRLAQADYRNAAEQVARTPHIAVINAGARTFTARAPGA